MTLRALAALSALVVLTTAGPAAAGTGPGTPAALVGNFGSYWEGFLDHWRGVFQKQNGIVMATLLLGAVCLFVITRGKWKK